MTVDSARDKESCVQVIINCDKESDILHTQLEQCTVSVCAYIVLYLYVCHCFIILYCVYVNFIFIFQAAAS